MANRVKLTRARKKRFLEALRETGTVSGACRAVGVSRGAAYKQRTNDCEFADAWDEAIEELVDEAEAELFRRAVRGVDKPVFYRGKQVALVREYSDGLLRFLMTSRRPEVYSGKGTGQKTEDYELRIDGDGDE